MSRPIDRVTVEHVAKLARLRLSDEETAQLERELGAVLEYVARLKELDTEGVEPMSAPGDRSAPLADDEPVEGLAAEALLGIAPATHHEQLAVPRVLGE